MGFEKEMVNTNDKKDTLEASFYVQFMKTASANFDSSDPMSNPFFQ